MFSDGKNNLGGLVTKLKALIGFNENFPRINNDERNINIHQNFPSSVKYGFQILCPCPKKVTKWIPKTGLSNKHIWIRGSGQIQGSLM